MQAQRLQTPLNGTVVSAIETEERRLLALVASQHSAAFDALYRLYHSRLNRFLERVLRRRELVDEILDDTMMVVWLRAATFNGQSKVSTWIFAIAYRTALKALRQAGTSADENACDELASPQPDPEQTTRETELHDVLLRALDQLTPGHRAVIVLTYFHGASCKEIAEIVDCPVDTVKTRMFYARRRLKALMPGTLEDWL